ncbi:MAG: diaminopimelate epimerase [Dehalococcoidia bacterium]
MKFTKMQATGNDFIVVDAHKIEQDWPALAHAMCRRRFGVGADGLILVLPSDKAHFRMRMLNPDGSEAEACGNGLRCFVRYAVDKRLTGEKALKIETMAGIREAQYNSGFVRVAMGSPLLAPQDIPVEVKSETYPILNYSIELSDSEIEASFVSMGNPHAVAFIDRPVDSFPLTGVGPHIEYHPIFPNRTNFEVVNVVGKGKLKARVWERGAGETLSCGTGACAIAVAARLQEVVGDRTEVELPGGTLVVEWDGKEEVWLSGPAEIIFDGKWDRKTN